VQERVVEPTVSTTLPKVEPAAPPLPATAPPAAAAPAAAAPAIADDAKEPAVPIVTPSTVVPSPVAPSPAKRELARAIPKPRAPVRPRAQDTETAKPAPAQRQANPRNGKSPFSDVPFDDNDNSADAAPGSPSRQKVKTTPIVTEFGN